MRYLIAILSLIGTVCSAQLKASELPTVLRDTNVFYFDVYVQTIEQEAHQQAKIFGLERKIDRLKTIIHEKKRIEPIIDSLFMEIKLLESITDSLDLVIAGHSREIVVDCSLEIMVEREKIKGLKANINYLIEGNKKRNKVIFYMSCGLIGQTLLLLL